MKNLLRFGLLMSVGGLLVSLGLSGCARVMPLGKHDFRVKGNQLRRGDNAFTLYAFQDPDLGGQGATLKSMVPSMAHIAEVGGNTVCFDLAGFNEDGTEIDPEAVKTVSKIADRGKDQRMALMVRVLGDSTDPAFRENAVKTAAEALKREGRAVYWIDGPNAAELAALFKKKAPRLVVAAPAGGDVRTIEKTPVKPPEQAVLLVDGIPDFDAAEVSFVLSGDEADYAALDKALTRPEELLPWKPDNSVLSEQEREEGFIALFDGKTLDGWWMKDDNKEAFHVSEDGFIEWREKGGGALMTVRRYGDFILRCEWKILPGGNSGIWMRAPRDSRQSKIGMECQLRGDSGTEEPDKSNTGAVYDVLPPLAMPAHKEGQWNTFEARFDGPHYKAWINGVLVQDVNFDEHEELKYRLRKGFICLTDHGDYVAYRNIRLKEL